MNNAAYFIASYGKPDNILTVKTLLKHKAEYPIYIVVGKDDPRLEEYEKIDNVFVFDKNDYHIDSLGSYRETKKICTYSRPAIYDLAKKLGVKYIVYLYDDIIKFTLRYAEGDKVKSTSNFKIDLLVDMYIDLLNSSDKIYFTGPPCSSFYTGIKGDRKNTYTQKFANMIVYDVDKQFEPYKINVIEDLTMIMDNNERGKLSVCPFGLRLDCRPPLASGDSYGGMSMSEYLQQKSIMCGGIDIQEKRRDMHVPYAKHMPKIIDEKYRQVVSSVYETDLWS